MAVIACHECKKEISSEAKKCPHCGAPPKKSVGVFGLVLVAITGIVAYNSFRDQSTSAPPGSPTPTSAIPTTVASDDQKNPFVLDQKAGRKYLADRLEEHCRKQDAHLNYIKMSVRPAGAGVALYCVHDFYTKYSLSAGGRAPALSDFVQSNAELLRKNKVSRVGVWGTGQFASGAWFEVPKP